MVRKKTSTDTLRSVLGGLSDEDVAELNRVSIRKHYPSEAIVCREGEMEHTFYVIESGLVSVTQRMGDGAERMLGVKRGGEFFGEMALLDDVPRAATVRTLTESWLIEVSEETFDAIIQRNPSVALTVLKSISQTLRESDNLTIAELTLKNQELSNALEELRKAQAELLRQERLKRDLEIATTVQQSILPSEFPTVKGFEFAKVSRSAREVGGDFYDVFELEDDLYGFVIADVSGKSWQAAIFMAIVKALLSREVQETSSPLETMHQLHQQVLKTSTADMFVTIFYGVINTETRQMRYIRAGHERPILYRVIDKSLRYLDVPGRFVGLWPELILEEAEMTLLPGDTLVCYSDGVPDAENAQGEKFGLDRLLTVVSAKGHLSAKEVAQHITNSVDQFRAGFPATDDITLLIAKVV